MAARSIAADVPESGCWRSDSGPAPFLRILRKAKVKPWPKLFQNQRSSRETELLKEFPVHVVCAWLGNTPRVALKHYAQVTDEDFKKATRSDSKRQAG